MNDYGRMCASEGAGGQLVLQHLPLFGLNGFLCGQTGRNGEEAYCYTERRIQKNFVRQDPENKNH